MNLLEQEDEFENLSNGLRICYRRLGHPDSPAVILIAGLGLQLVSWPEALIHRLLSSGLQVICFDNRDVGLSSRLSTPSPSLWQQFRGKAPSGCYRLEDMADDTALLMDSLRLERAHLVGMSMGGMIAQTLAYRHPSRAGSLTSIFSTTGNRKVGQPAYSTYWHLARTKSPRTEAEAVKIHRALMNKIGDRTPPDIESQWRQYASLAWKRNGESANVGGRFRQIGAIMSSGDRTRELATIDTPTLVIHGDKDPMVHPTGGVATARAIPNARYEVIRGMRHQIDTHQSLTLADKIIRHTCTTFPTGAPA